MSARIIGLGTMMCEDANEEFNFERAYANNLSDIKASYKAAGIIPTQRDIDHARIKSAVYAATDLGRSDSMGAFFANSQDPEDGMFGNLMPTLDWF